MYSELNVSTSGSIYTESPKSMPNTLDVFEIEIKLIRVFIDEITKTNEGRVSDVKDLGSKSLCVGHTMGTRTTCILPLSALRKVMMKRNIPKAYKPLRLREPVPKQGISKRTCKSIKSDPACLAGVIVTKMPLWSFDIRCSAISSRKSIKML